MAYDEALARRIREIVAGRPGVTEIKMFGGIAFMTQGGNMFCGISHDDLMARVGPAQQEAAYALPGTKPMQFNGRVMSAIVLVEPSGVESDADLRRWLDQCYDYTMTLPAKQPKAKLSNK